MEENYKDNLRKTYETNTELSGFLENVEKEAVEEQTEETQNYENGFEYKRRDFANSFTFSERRGEAPDDYLVQEKSFDPPSGSNQQSSPLTSAIRTRNKANVRTIQSIISLQSWTRLFHSLAHFFFTSSETEIDYYHQKVNVRVASRVAK